MLASVVRSPNMTSVASRLVFRGCNSGMMLNKRCLKLSALNFDPEKPQSKLDDLFPRVEDFPSHHIGPRKIEAKVMLQELGYNVSTSYINIYITASKNPRSRG